MHSRISLSDLVARQAREQWQHSTAAVSNASASGELKRTRPLHPEAHGAKVRSGKVSMTMTANAGQRRAHSNQLPLHPTEMLVWPVFQLQGSKSPREVFPAKLNPGPDCNRLKFQSGLKLPDCAWKYAVFCCLPQRPKKGGKDFVYIYIYVYVYIYIYACIYIYIYIYIYLYMAQPPPMVREDRAPTLWCCGPVGWF